MTQPKSVGFAVVGLGHISERAVLPAFRHAKRSHLVALVSSDPQKAKRFAAKFKVPRYFTYDRLEECLNDSKVEAVYIATNNSSHLDFTLRAAAAGKHVLCEKPLANNAEECRRMIEACRKHDVYLMTAYRKYFEPAVLDLKKLLTSGKLGRLKLIHSAFTFNLPEKQVWHLSRDLAGGGSLLDVGVYCINTVRWLTGLEPNEATAYSWTSDPDRFKEVEESISFQLKFPGEVYMQASSSFAADKASFLQIHAEKGWAALNPAYAYNEERRLFGQIGVKWFGKIYKPIEEFHFELDHLSACIRAKREPEPNGVTGLRDVAIMQAIYDAAASGRPVPITLPM
jgi:predicted dehydrogenase